MTKGIKMPAFHNEPKHAWARAALAAALMVAAGAASAQGGQVVQGAPDPGIRLGKSGTAAPTHVCIDSTSSPAWTLMYATADAGCSKKEMERVTVKDFQSSAVRSRLRARVLRDAMAGTGQDALTQIGAFLVRMPGAPIGLTWDGGMAITYNDYNAAEKRHAAYLKDSKR